MHDRTPPVFHLSISVSDMNASSAFYEEVLNARPGRKTAHWMDLWLFGAQLTIHQRSAAVIPSPYREAQHFGATLAWSDWTKLERALQLRAPQAIVQRVLDPERGVAKLILSDPDDYLVEIKAYRDPDALSRPAG